MLETRALPGAAVTDVNSRDHTVTARVLVYDRADSYGSVWRAGVMSDSLRAAKPVICAHHDLSRPIARVADYDDGDTALDLHLVMADLDAVPDARTAFSLMESKIIGGWSVGFVRNKWDAVPKEQRSDYGEHEAKEYMVQCGLREASLVSLPSVPGVGTLAIRAEETPTLTVITIEDIERQFKSDLLDRHEARAMLAALSPEHRLHIILTKEAPVVPIEKPEERTDPEPDPVATALVETSAAKAEVIADAVAPGTAEPIEPDDDEDPEDDDTRTLAASTAAAMREALSYMALGTEDGYRQAQALMQAGGVVADELLESLGISGADGDVDVAGGAGRSAEAPEVTPEAEVSDAEAREDPEAEERALTLSTKPWDPKPADYTIAAWRNSCLIWDGPDDQVGSGSLPVKEPDGTVNKAALAAAAGRLGQTDASDADKTAAARKLMSFYAQAKMKSPPSLLAAARSVEDPEVREMAVELELDGLDDIFSRHGVAAA